jgi:phage terminase large subunit GpA-like protein
MVKAHARDYQEGEKPADVQIITCGVDVQSDRLYYIVRGYGYKSESWLIEAGALMGSTTGLAVWAALKEVLSEKYDHMPIARCFIDSGYTPGRDKDVRPDNVIYDFCRIKTPGLSYPTKGKDMMDRPIRPSKIDVTSSGKTIKGGITLWWIDTDYFKRQFYSNVRQSPDAKRGWHVHLAVSEEYCRQVTSEECITSERGTRTWIKIRRDNHYLDCEVLADAAAYSIGVHSLKNLEVPEKKKHETEQPEKVPFIRRRSEGSFIRR